MKTKGAERNKHWCYATQGNGVCAFGREEIGRQLTQPGAVMCAEFYLIRNTRHKVYPLCSSGGLDGCRFSPAKSIFIPSRCSIM